MFMIVLKLPLQHSERWNKIMVDRISKELMKGQKLNGPGMNQENLHYERKGYRLGASWGTL